MSEVVTQKVSGAIKILLKLFEAVAISKRFVYIIYRDKNSISSKAGESPPLREN